MVGKAIDKNVCYSCRETYKHKNEVYVQLYKYIYYLQFVQVETRATFITKWHP